MNIPVGLCIAAQFPAFIKPDNKKERSTASLFLLHDTLALRPGFSLELLRSYVISVPLFPQAAFSVNDARSARHFPQDNREGEGRAVVAPGAG